MRTIRSRLPIGLWVLALGGVGFAAGSLGPIVLNPDANQGPLLGLFITGPRGAAAGLVLGAIFNLARVSRDVQLKVLGAACAVLGVGTLFFCLPEPERVASIIDATVAECAPPTESARAALARWEAAVAHATSHSPDPNWKARALKNLEQASGVVLTMHVVRRATVYRHRKPWNSGKLFVSEWSTPNEMERYYASDEGRSCNAYLSRERELYTPFTDSPARPMTAAREWPPTDVTSFLSLMELGPVPERYRQYLQP